MLAKMCLFPSVARIFSISTARFRPGVRTKTVFFHRLLKNRVLARGVFQKLSPKHFNRVFHYFFARQNVLISFAEAHIFDFLAHVSSESVIFIDFGPRAGSGSIFYIFFRIYGSGGVLGAEFSDFQWKLSKSIDFLRSEVKSIVFHTNLFEISSGNG